MTTPTILISPNSGSSAYLKDIWCYRDLVLLFVKRDFTAKYKQTILGPLWHFIQPIMTTLVSFLLFNVVANIGTDGTNPILFQMSGIIIWGYFSACLTNTSNTFVTNANIFGKVYFPRLVMPLSTVISQLIQFGIQLLLLLFAMAFFALRGQGFPINVGWLVVPLILIIMAALGLGFGILISSVTTKYRDLQVLVTFGVQLFMFVSAVNYPLSALQKLSPNKQWVYQLVRYNPIAALVESFRNAMLGGAIPWMGLGYSALFAIGITSIGVYMFGKVEKTFMDTV